VPYRPTERTEARKAEVRERIVAAAHRLIARGGYGEAQIAAVAHEAGVATGTVYRYFPSKSELFADVFREASQREVDAMAAVSQQPGGGAAERIAAGVETFARRALRGRRMAYSLLAEPVDPAIEAERLVFRRAYRDVLAAAIADSIESGELPDQDVAVTAAALVGAIGEALVGPLSPASPRGDDDALVDALVQFCVRSVTGKENALVAA
jgi:AcrR family transcriptional regulator